MVFDPQNELERAMLLAASHESARPDFYRLLMVSELVVLGELGEGMSIELLENNGRKFHPVFTSEARLNDFVPRPMPNFRMKGRVLFSATRGAAFVINPGAEIAKILEPEEIAYWLDAPRPQHPQNVVVVQPKVYPTRLVKALCVLFTSRSLIKAAHLAYVAQEGVDREPHPLIGLEADGDVPRLVHEIQAVGAEALPGVPVDVFYLPSNEPLNPLQTHLLSIAPFYRRTLAMN